MKYIRTKDGRILNLDKIKFYAESYSFNNESETHLSIECDIIREEIDIIKQADTIEELIDKYVIKNPENNCLDILESLGIINVQLFNESNLIVYGAVWTDKGLIYVAKMNDKGELELL